MTNIPQEPILAGSSVSAFVAGYGITLAELNEILATASFVVGIIAGVLAIVRHFRNEDK